jgi:hypothetical protein
MAPSGAMGKRRRDGNHNPQKNNSIQDSVGNEKNGYPVSYLHKTMITVTKQPSEHPHKNPQRRNFGRCHQEIHEEDTRHS